MQLSAIFAPDTVWGLWFFTDSGFSVIRDLGDPVTGDAAKARILTDIATLPIAGGQTPLAHTLCEGVDALTDHSTPADRRQIFLASDGEENNTPFFPGDQCGGPYSVSTIPPYDIGPPRSWQNRVYNKLCSGSPDSPGFCPASPFIFNAIHLYDDFADSFSARRIFAPNLEGPILGAAALTVPTVEVDKAFFSRLARDTHGTYRAITSDTPLSVAFLIPGDANGDTCVNALDVSQVQRDSGTPGNGIDDFNHNGTVDNFDLQTVLANAGRGCWSGSATPNLPTLDKGTVCTTLSVNSQGGDASRVKLDLSGRHDFRSILRGTLAHNGVTVPAFPVGTFPSGAGDFSLTSRPVLGLSGDQSGPWTLCIVDTDGFLDTGILKSWSVHN